MLSKSTCLVQVAHLVVRRGAATAVMAETATGASACPFHGIWAKKQQQTYGAVTPGVARARDGVRSYEEMPTPRSLPVIGTTLDVVKFGGASRIHEYCDHRHKQLGSVYREKLGAVEAVFVAESSLLQQVYANEGRYPQHMVPEAWTIYNEKHDIKRGLFFM